MAQTLSYASVTRGVEAAVKSALADRGKPVSIAVVDGHGEMIHFARMDGAPERSISIAINKAYTSARMHRDTHDFLELLRRLRVDISSFSDPRFTALGGGAAIFKDGTQECIGGVGVSGRNATEDFEIACIMRNSL